MYNKQEASLLRQEFWTSFGKYIAPIPSADGTKINWINYKTGIRHIFFKMQADHQNASISIELNHTDEAQRIYYFKKFELLKDELQQLLPEEWEWQLNAIDEQQRPISTISTKCTNVNLFNKEDWPTLISFFKPRIIALDVFWSEYKFAFETLAKRLKG